MLELENKLKVFSGNITFARVSLRTIGRLTVGIRVLLQRHVRWHGVFGVQARSAQRSGREKRSRCGG